MTAYSGFATSVLTAWSAGKPLKAMLVDSTYVYSDTHTHRSDITGELTATGYAPVALTNAAVSGTKITCDPISFGSFTTDVTGLQGVIFYWDSGDPATSTLVCADLELGPTDLPAGTAVTYTVDATSGVVSISAAS